MPSITPFLSASHLCSVLPEQCGAHAFLKKKSGRERNTPTTVKPSFTHLWDKDSGDALYFSVCVLLMDQQLSK